VSDEDEKKIEETFITKLGAKYPFVKAKGCNEAYGIKFFPSVYVIDASGNVFSVPDDRMPSEAQIETLLGSVSLAPKLPDDPRYAPIKSMWEKKEHVKLRDYLDKMLAQPNLDAAMREVFDAQKAELGKRVDNQQKRVERLAAGPDYAASQEQLQKLEKDWKGFPPADAARKELDRFAADPAIKKEIAAGKALTKLCSGFDTSRVAQARKLAVELEKFVKKYEGTQAALQAEELRKRYTRE
jgi:hypothetical protein